ncbi:MAG TPA: hypothetical protein VE650_19185 [Acetobacteraceae bacterium]|nr:hypothetical protein [Acetobacteraceae bacterium]
MPFPASSLTVQTASLYSTGTNSIFSGSGGPWGYDPFFGQFGNVISSSGLDSTPYSDQLWNVAPGDEVVFVVALQNRAALAAYDVLIRDTIPQGFAIPSEGTGLSVTDGAGWVLNTTGDLFDANGGLRLTDPVPSYAPDSGANVVLVTFTLQATAQLALPLATVQNTAQILNFAAQSGGPNLASGADPATLAASTPMTSNAITVQTVSDQSAVSLPSGQQASFDVTVTLPEGLVRDLRLDEIMPHSGDSWLHLVSATVTHIGANLTVQNQAAVQPDGSITFGNVLSTTPLTGAPDNTIVMHVTVDGAGTQAGQGVLQTVVSAVDPNNPASRWSSTQVNVLALEKPNHAPTIGGSSGGQNATNSMQVRPFAAITFNDEDVGQVETLTIHLSDPLLGTLTGDGLVNMGSGNYTIQGTVDHIQAEARSLLFKAGPGNTGAETFTLTLDDGAGGVATDASTVVSIAATAPGSEAIQRYPLASTGSVVTSSVGGNSTIAQVETYGGPVDYVQCQFIYDGTAPVAIVAQTPNVFIKSTAGYAAVQLLSGQNVVDAGKGSNFLLAGTGQDVFFLDGRNLQETWDTIVGFKPGDIATLWGFKDGVSRYWWDDNSGVAGFTGRTLRADLTGSGNIDASITFANTTQADTNRYALTTGTVGGNEYMTIFSL